MDLGLAGKKVIVTGGSRGIGKAIVDRMIAEQASVSTCARTASALNELIEGYRAQGANAYGAAIDVRDQGAYRHWFEDSVEFLGGVDIFISNVTTRIRSEGEQRWIDAFEADVLHHVRATELAIPYLSESDHGAMVFISSIASVMANIMPAEREYGAMKAALSAYASQQAHRLAPKGIRSNIVTPGPIWFAQGFWDQVKTADADLFTAASKLSAMQRLGTPEEVANATVFLASPAASYVTGANLRVDGGVLKHTHF